MCGWVDGAIRSGERAASEVMALRTGRRRVTVVAWRRTTFMTTEQIESTQKNTIDTTAGLIVRYGLVIVLVWYGGLKFMSYEATASCRWCPKARS